LQADPHRQEHLAEPIRPFRIAGAFIVLLLRAVWDRVRPNRHGPAPAHRLRLTLEGLGPTFVKFGRALSLRRALLPDEYLSALGDLHDRVSPFPAAVARKRSEPR
jgi:ubiquinone biosynthesis protein